MTPSVNGDYFRRNFPRTQKDVGLDRLDWDESERLRPLWPWSRVIAVAAAGLLAICAGLGFVAHTWSAMQ